MHRKRRKLTQRFAARFCIASPLALLVSTSFLAPARANQFKPAGLATLPSNMVSKQPFNAITPLQTGNHPAQHLLIPTSILETRNTNLMRTLLLTHGIELDLSHDAQVQFVDDALLREIFDSDPLHKPVDFELVVADASGQFQLPDQPVGCAPGFAEDETEAGVSKNWKVLWIGSCEVIEADVTAADASTEESLVIDSPVLDLGAVEIQPAQASAIRTVPQDQSDKLEPVSPDDSSKNTGNNLVAPPQLNIDHGKEPANLQAEPAELQSKKKSNGLEFSDDVPEGFEALAGPQVHYVDIFLNGQKIGSTIITSTPEDFQFNDPTEVAMLLADKVDSQDIEALIAYPLATNGHKICFGEDEPPGCGQLKASPVAAIYNEGELSVTLFVTPELQKVQELDYTRYLSPPERKNSSIFSVYAVASELEDEEGSIDLSGRGVLGYGRGNINSEFDYNSRSGRQRLRALNLTHYFPDHELQLGTYSYQPRGGLTDFDMLAINYSTSLKTRVDLEHAFASELVVYLTRRSVVRLVIDDRVYSGDSYPAGNQVLDTRALPDGTYDVDIRILDPISGERIERRLFTKSAQIPPKGEMQYQLTAGVPLLFNDDRFFPDAAETGVAGASIARRLTNQSAFWLGLLQFGSRTFLQSEYIYLGDKISLQITSSMSRDNTMAGSLRTSYSLNSVTANLSFNSFQSDFVAEEDSALELLFPANFRQVNFSLSKTLKTGFIGLRSSYRREDTELNNSSLTQYSLFYRRPVFRRKNIQGLVETNLQQDDAGRRINLQFRAFFNDTPLNGSLLSEAIYDEDGNTSYFGSLGVNWQHDTDTAYDYDFGAYVSAAEDDRFIGASAAVEHPWFTSGFSTDWNNINGGGYHRSSIATLSAHAGADARGAALGGADFAQAGVIISIQGEPRGETFDILVNGIKASTGQIGTSQFIGLQPFENYRIKLVPRTVLSNGIGEDIYEFTLYPGSVQRIETVAQKQILLIATLVNKFGELVENAVIDRGSNPLWVEEGGFFQAEVMPGERIIVKPVNAAQCEFVVPESAEEEVLVMEAPLLCEDSPATPTSLH